MFTYIWMSIKNFQYQNNQCKSILAWSNPDALAEDAGSMPVVDRARLIVW